MNLQVDRLTSDVNSPTAVPFNPGCTLNRLIKDVQEMILLEAFNPKKPYSLVCRRFRQFFNKQIKDKSLGFFLGERQNREKIFVAFPNIKSLDTFTHLIPRVAHFLQRQRIEELTIQAPFPTIPEIPLLETLCELPSLKKVKIINCNVRQQGLNCTIPPSVTTLSLINIEGSFRIQQCDNLQHLDVLNCPQITQEGINFAVLKTIRWESAPAVDPQLISHAFHYDFDTVYRSFGVDVEWTKKFIENGCDIDIIGKDPTQPLKNKTQTPLLLACQLNDLERVKTFIAHGANINVRDSEIFTPLHIAVKLNFGSLVDFLIDAGANVKSTAGGYTPLYYCTDPTIMQALLKAGADPNLGNILGYTPLHRALRHSDPRLLRILIAAGANVDLPDNTGKTPLELAQNPIMYPPSFYQIFLEAHLAEQAKNSNRKEAP